MTYFGETLRKAREAKGLTTSQVAEKTRILVQIINAMEKEDFSRIMAPIYGRGFVKLICECLEIDPKPLVAEFMDIYTGKRPPVSSDPFKAKQPATEAVAPVPDQEAIAQRPKAAIAEPELPLGQSTSAMENSAIVTASLPPEPPPNVSSGELPPEEEATPAKENGPAAESTPVTEDTPLTEDTPVTENTPVTDDSPVPENTPVIANTPVTEDIQPADIAVEAAVPEEVKGLELFDPQVTSAAEAPPVSRAQDIFSPSYSETSAKVPSGPSAAERFRTGLSVVSHGVIGSVRSIPRSAWRISVLVVGACVVIALLIWGCMVLYRVTEHPIAEYPAEPAAAAKKQVDVPKPAAPKAAPKATKSANVPKTDPKAVNAAKTDKGTAKPRPMRTTGQKVPPLYVD